MNGIEQQKQQARRKKRTDPQHQASPERKWTGMHISHLISNHHKAAKIFFKKQNCPIIYFKNRLEINTCFPNNVVFSNKVKMCIKP